MVRTTSLTADPEMFASMLSIEEGAVPLPRSFMERGPFIPTPFQNWALPDTSKAPLEKMLPANMLPPAEPNELSAVPSPRVAAVRPMRSRLPAREIRAVEA